MKTNSIRIIGGQWKTRKLEVIDQEGLRPSTDRIRETLFNWLMPMISSTRVLDCYAGTGILGFESLSRGAKWVTFLEKESRVIRQLKENRLKLNCDQCEITQTDRLSYLKKNQASLYDLVFIDPPFHHNLASQTVELLESHGWVKEGSYIYVETELYAPFVAPRSWRLHREIKTKQIHSQLFIKGD